MLVQLSFNFTLTFITADTYSVWFTYTVRCWKLGLWFMVYADGAQIFKYTNIY